MDLALIILIISVTIMYMTSRICDTLEEICKKDKEESKWYDETKRSTRWRRYINITNDKWKRQANKNARKRKYRFKKIINWSIAGKQAFRKSCKEI